jgi:hypothetical protein
MARVARTKAKDMERAQQTRRAIVAGIAIEAMAAAGDPDAQRAWDKMLAGLKRKQDRLVFGLEPLPESRPDDHQPVNPPAPPDLSAADARVVRAVEAWKSAASEATRVELGQSVAEFEKLTGELWSGLKPEARAGFGLADRPGELDRAS